MTNKETIKSNSIRIFTFRNRANIIIKTYIRFYILRIGRGLATRGSYNCNINKPLLRIVRIRTYNNSS